MRLFTEDERKLLSSIHKNKGLSLLSLIAPWIEGVTIFIDTEKLSVELIFEEDKYRPELLQTIQIIVVQSVNLVKLFEDKGYILTFVNINLLPSNPFAYGQATQNDPVVRHRFPDPRLSKMFCEYSFREIFATPELGKFIDDGFITREEGRANRQWRTTRRALRVAIVALVLNALFNLYNIVVKSWAKDPIVDERAENSPNNPENKVTLDSSSKSDAGLNLASDTLKFKVDSLRK
jgi:hypothetical protein